MNELSIIQANLEQVDDALAFYHKLIDDMAGTGLVKWEKGVYPTGVELTYATTGTVPFRMYEYKL